MFIISLIICGLISLFAGVFILIWQNFKITRGLIIVDENYDGSKQVGEAVHIILRIAFKRSLHFRRFLIQYILHFFVRVLSLFDRLSFYLYAKSRNSFVKTAVKNRGTVPHFWNHLKVYKQEMDREKESKE